MHISSKENTSEHEQLKRKDGNTTRRGDNEAAPHAPRARRNAETLAAHRAGENSR
jgi:hypothetical protein